MQRFSGIADVGGTVVAVLGLHLAAIQQYPILYGGDTIIRLVNSSKILIAYQLPLFQALIHFTVRWFHGRLGIWALMGLLSAAAAAGLYALTLQVTEDRRAARIAAALYITHPFILFYSLVPYQESLLLAGIVWGFFFLCKPASWQTSILSSLALAAACLTRYEGWIAAAMAVLFSIYRWREQSSSFSFKRLIRVTAVFGWAPLLWILWNRGLSRAGTFVVDSGFEWARLYRPYFVVKSAIWWTESAVIVMALFGFAALWIRGRRRHGINPHWMLASFVLLFICAMIFSGHGIKPDPIRFVTEREAYVPIALLILYAGAGGSLVCAGMEKMLSNIPALGRSISVIALVVIACLGLNRGFDRIAAANRDPEVKTDYEVAQFLAEKQARALILARPLPQDELNYYLSQAEKTGGADGKAMALKLLREVETTPFDYQRVLAFSWLGKEKILSGDRLLGLDETGIENFIRQREVDRLVVFSDFIPVQDHERILLSIYAHGRPEIRISNGNRGALIFHKDLKSSGS